MAHPANSPTRRPGAPRARGGLTALAVAAALLATASGAHAALTTGKCLALKRKAWGTLRKCQATEQAKGIQGKLADLAKCTTKFDGTLMKLDAKAAAAGVGCRYRDNGDATVTDFATGLMWEQKIDAASLPCMVFAPPSCLDRTFVWKDALSQFLTDLNGLSDNGVSQSGTVAGYTDWRLPISAELQAIVDQTVPGCGSGGPPCIDPAFGPTLATFYWSSTTEVDSPTTSAWGANFDGNLQVLGIKTDPHSVRAVRRDL